MTAINRADMTGMDTLPQPPPDCAEGFCHLPPTGVEKLVLCQVPSKAKDTDVRWLLHAVCQVDPLSVVKRPGKYSALISIAKEDYATVKLAFDNNRVWFLTKGQYYTENAGQEGTLMQWCTENEEQLRRNSLPLKPLLLVQYKGPKTTTRRKGGQTNSDFAHTTEKGGGGGAAPTIRLWDDCNDSQ